MEQENRVIVLIDMDCFYCQVEEKLDPELKGQPIAVVQYNPWKGGGIIAVNYVARARGVTRHMRGDEAREKCPEIRLPSVPCQRGKADITKYREAGKEVARVLQRFTPLLERASIDEAYLDITAPVQERLKTLNPNSINPDMIPNTYALGYNNIEEFISDVYSCGSDSIEFDYEHAKRLLVGAVVVSEIRAAVYEETGYTCSAGISHNKILAKLVCGMNKPNKQTVLPKHSINILYKTLPVKKVKHLGGKFGYSVCEILKISNMGDLQKFTEKELQARFDEKNGTWLYNIARGIDLEPVQARFNPKSIGCCKQLRGKSALTDLESLKKWLKDLGDEIEDRLETDALETNRTPKQMVVSFSTQGHDGRDASSSRSYNFGPDDELCGDFFSNKALELVLDSLGVKLTAEDKNRKLKASIQFLGISVGKFEDNSNTKKVNKIVDYFAAGSSNVTKSNADVKRNGSKELTCNKNAKKNEGKEYILQKFFKATDKNAEQNSSKAKVVIAANVEQNNEQNEASAPVLETPLQKQESFFARLLNKGKNAQNISNEARPTTPVCNVVNCGEDSNDTDYSGSTINNEINKSIALFDEDANEIARVSNMRDLMNKSSVFKDDSNEDFQEEESKNDSKTEEQAKDCQKSSEDIQEPNTNVQTFQCSECGKTLPIHMFETHADYHFALKLREEERKRVRDETKQKSTPKTKALTTEEVKRKKEEQNKNNVSSIASFLVKIDDQIPTEVCSKCGKKVAIEKFAEHLDFHEAQKLNKELNKKVVSTNIFKDSSVKRKRKSISPLKKPKLSCTSSSRSIDSFFR